MAGSSSNLRSQPISSARDAPTAAHSTQPAGAGGWRGEHTSRSGSVSHESRQASSFPTHTDWNGPVPPSTSSSAHPHRPRQSDTRQHAGSTSQPPVSASDSVPNGQAVPVPSEEQVHDYLVTHMGQREGLYTGWEIQGHRFDVYTLFKSVIQMGGSSSVSQQDQWMYIATILRFPMATQSPRVHQRIGLELRDFFLRTLGGLEILWERTADADRPKAPHRALHFYSTSEAVRRQDLSLAALNPDTIQTRPSWPPRQATPGDRSDYLPTPNTSHFKSQHLQVHDLTNSTPPNISKSPQPGHPTQPRTSASQNTHQNSQPQSYAQSIRPTPSPVHEQSQRVAPATSGQYQDLARTSEPNAIAPPPAVGRVGTNTPSTSQPGNRRQSSASYPPTSSRGMDYDPPVVTSFEQLVDIQALPPPPHGSGLAVPNFAGPSGPYLHYAYRAQELRSSIRKMSAGEAHRQISAEEILWWNKLVLLLQKNPKVVIPKPMSSATATQPPPLADVHHREDASARPSTINPNSIRNLVQAPVISPPLPTPSSTFPTGTQADPSSQIPDPKPKKKRGRPPKVAQTPAGTQEGQGGPQTTGTDGASAPVKKKRGRPPKRKTDDDPDHAGTLLRQTKKQRIDTGGQVASMGQSSSVLPTPVSASTLSQQIDPNPAVGSHDLPKRTDATAALEPASGSRSTPAADFLRSIQAKQGWGSGPAQDTPTAGEGSSAPMPTTLAAAAAQFEHDHLTQGASLTPGRVGSNGQSESPSMSASRSKAAKARWDRYRAQAAMQAEGGASSLSGTPTFAQAPSVVDSATPTGSKGQPLSPSASADRSNAAKARWDRYRAQAAIQTQGAPSNLGTPTFVRAPSVVNSASPIRVLDLSGSRISHAQLTERDAKTPTKVIVKSKPAQPSRLSQSDAPNDATNASGEGANSLVVEDEDDAFNPFMELSQSWAVPEPVKKNDQFVPYAPARKPVHRDAEEDAMPEEVDLAALAAVLSAELGGIEDAGVEVVDQHQDFEIQEQPPPATQSRRKGKGKASGQRKEIPARSQAVEPVVEIVTRHSPLTKRGKRTSRAAEGNGLSVPSDHAKLPPATPPKASSVRAGKGKSFEPTLAHRTRLGSSQRTPRSATPQPSEQKRPTARRTGQKSSGLRFTRSLGGPPSSALRDRHVTASPKQIARKKDARPAPKRLVRSPSIVMISPPAKPKARASKPSKSHLRVRVEDSDRTPRGGAVDRAVVSIPIRGARRRRLILLGYYDAFRDDDSDGEEEAIQRGNASLRPLKIQPSRSKARSIRPREPEMLPPRFAHRPGPALVEPFHSVLDEKSLLRRAVEHECGWKGCDAILGSEALLHRHVDFRQHVLSARFQTGPGNAQTLWRCHWRACEGPCFESEKDVSQHVIARHISRVLDCPYRDCDLASPNVSHLSRHVMKQHDEDEPRPLADLSVRLEPPFPLPKQPLPETARTDELTTPSVPGSRYGSEYRREWARLRVKNNCFGGDHPIIHVEHPPHMLQTQEEDGAESDDSEDEERLYQGVEMAETKLLDKAECRRSRWEVVVAVPTRRELARGAVLATSA